MTDTNAHSVEAQPGTRKAPDLVNDPIVKLMAMLAIPAGIGFLFSTLYNLVDSFWANQLGGQLGTSDPVDAMGAGGGYFFLMLAFSIGLNQGATAMITNALGRGDQDAARTSFFQTLALGLSISIALAVFGAIFVTSAVNAQFAERPEMAKLALDYLVPIYMFSFSFIFGMVMNSALSAQGDFITLGVVQIIAFFLNCVFDPLFMFGWGPVPAFGIQGLAVATITINVIGMLVIVYRTVNSPLFIGTRLGSLSSAFKLTGMGDLIRQCVPASLNMAVIALGYIVIAEVLSYFSSGAIGGFSNASRIEQLILLPVIGLQIAVLAIIGQNMGAEQFERVQRTFVVGTRIALIIMGIGMLLVWIFHDFASQGFAAGNQDIRRMSNLYLLYSSLSLMAYALVLISGGVLQGMKRPVFPLIINLLRLVAGPFLIFWVITLFFDQPNIHALWIGANIVSWSCGLYSYFYVRRVIKTLVAQNQRTL